MLKGRLILGLFFFVLKYSDNIIKGRPVCRIVQSSMRVHKMKTGLELLEFYEKHNMRKVYIDNALENVVCIILYMLYIN